MAPISLKLAFLEPILNRSLAVTSPVLEILQPVLDRLLLSRIPFTVLCLKRTASKVRDEPELHFFGSNRDQYTILHKARGGGGN